MAFVMLVMAYKATLSMYTPWAWFFFPMKYPQHVELSLGNSLSVGQPYSKIFTIPMTQVEPRPSFQNPVLKQAFLRMGPSNCSFKLA